MQNPALSAQSCSLLYPNAAKGFCGGENRGRSVFRMGARGFTQGDAIWLDRPHSQPGRRTLLCGLHTLRANP